MAESQMMKIMLGIWGVFLLGITIDDLPSCQYKLSKKGPLVNKNLSEFIKNQLERRLQFFPKKTKSI